MRGARWRPQPRPLPRGLFVYFAFLTLIISNCRASFTLNEILSHSDLLKRDLSVYPASFPAADNISFNQLKFYAGSIMMVSCSLFIVTINCHDVSKHDAFTVADANGCYVSAYFHTLIITTINNADATSLLLLPL